MAGAVWRAGKTASLFTEHTQMYTVSVLLNTSLHLCTRFDVRMSLGNSQMWCRYVHLVLIGRSACGISFFVECYSVLLNVFNIISNLIH